MKTVPSLKNIASSLDAAKLIDAEPKLCWQNAANLKLEAGFEHATYVEGVVISPRAPMPVEHAWLVLDGEIIDPTLPEREMHYIPAHEWAGGEFERLYFSGSKPFFRRVEFLTDGVQVMMDQAREKAATLASTWT